MQNQNENRKLIIQTVNRVFNQKNYRCHSNKALNYYDDGAFGTVHEIIHADIQ